MKILKDKNNYDLNNINKRNYGLDLLRIISMINIINLHINLFSHQLFIKYCQKYKNIWRLEVVSYFAVDAFGLLSGYVGYKGYKFSNLIYLWFLVLFYSVSISLYLYFIYIGQISTKSLFLHFFPILIKRHWYVNAYFSMYLFLPFVNLGINNIDRKLYRNIIAFFVIFYSFYNIFALIYGNKNYNFLMNGYSSKWLTILYIIGAYFGKYNNKRKFEILDFIFCFLTYICSSLFTSELKIRYKKANISKIFISYLSPTMILQALSLLIFFSKINISNIYLINIISFITPLNFSAQLIHARLFQTKMKVITKLFTFISNIKNYAFFKYYGISIIIYIICIFLDYFRFLIFKILRIKQFSILLEKKYRICLKNYIIFNKYYDDYFWKKIFFNFFY